MRHVTVVGDSQCSSLEAIRVALAHGFRQAGLVGAMLLLVGTGPAAVAESSESNPTNPAKKRVLDETKSDQPPASPRLEALLVIRSNVVWLQSPQTTDEVIALAVARGTNPDLEPKNPFRKRSRDLFRTERPVTIGNADMLLRLRLRAKARRAMSIELRY